MRLRRFLPSLQGLIGWTTLLLVCASALLLAANRPLGWLMLGTAVFVLFILQASKDLSDPGSAKRFQRLWPAALLWIAVMLWALIQTYTLPFAGFEHPSWLEAGTSKAPIAADPETAYHGIWRLLSYAALFWIAVESGQDANRVRSMLKVIAIWSALLAMYGIVTHLIGINPILGEITYKTVSSSFAGPNAYALYAGFGVFVCLTLILLDLSNRYRSRNNAREFGRNLLESMRDGGWTLWAGVAITSAAAFFSGSRAGTASILIGVLVLIFCAHSKQQTKIRWIMSLSVLFLMAIVILGASALIHDLAETGLGDTLRATVYAQTVTAIQASPWIGYGLGSFREAFRSFVTPEIGWQEFDLTHNSYLENIFELGIPGALALYTALGWIVVQIWRGLSRRRKWRALPALGIAVITAAGMHALVDFSLQMPASASLAAFLLGLAWRQSYLDPSMRTKRKRL